MKKLICILLGLFLCAGFISAQRTLSLKTKAETKGAEKTIPARHIEETTDGITVTYCFNNIVLQEDPLYANATTINIDGFWPNTNVGKPAVLSRWDTFVVRDANVKIVVSDSSYIELPLELSPARPILSNGGNEIYTTDNVRPIESFKGFFPAGIISATRNDSYRGQQLLDVCVTPVQYDYVNKKVRVFTKIKYKLQYDVDALKRTLSFFSQKLFCENTFLNNITLNYPLKELIQSSKSSSSSARTINCKYLIVSVPKYATAVNRFAEWKRTLGFDVRIEMRESWDTTMVKNVVHEAYETDNIEYLLIFGGHNDIPGIIRDKIFNRTHHYHPTDLYYGCMSSGYTPDIFRGRIPINTCDEAMTVVNKIINYEKNPVEDDFFYNRGIHCAYFQDWNFDGYEDRRFVLTSERVRDSLIHVIDSINRVYFTENNVYPTHWNQGAFANGEAIPLELQKPTFPWDGNSTNITNYINQKAFYVLMRDHGSEYQWGDPSYTRIDIGNLYNDQFLPVVFSICCLTGKFDVSNCFCESFLKKPYGGCVAIYGATQSSLSGPNDVMAEGMFDAIWPSLNLRPQFGIISGTSYSSTPTPTFRLGQILDQGLKRSDEAYLNTNKAWYPRYTSELFHCFGDPSMMIYTDKPVSFNQPSINYRNGKICVQSPCDSTRISFYTPSETQPVVDSFLGNYVEYETSADSVIVCLDKHNYVPYIQTFYKNIFIQNENINDNRNYLGDQIHVGHHVTTQKPVGNVVIENANVIINGNTVELHPGTTITHSNVIINGN